MTSSPYDEAPWTAIYPSGITAPTADETMLKVWRSAVDADPSAPCVFCGDETWSWGDIDRKSDAFAVGLIKGGLEPGDRVAILLQNDPEWLVALVAAWKAGGIAVAINPMFKDRELAYHLADCGAKVLVSLTELYHETAHRVVGDTNVDQVVLVGEPSKQDHDLGRWDVSSMAEVIELYSGQRPSRPDPSPGDTAVLTYTSGTTGHPKGAMNTHANIAYNSSLAAQWYRMDEGDVILGVAPLFHITGVVLHMALSWQARAPLVLLHRFDPAAAVEAASRRHATFTVGSITVFSAMIDRGGFDGASAPTLTKLASGGAPIAGATLAHIQETTGCYVHNVYGLTETTSPSHGVPLGMTAPVDARGAVSVGIPVPGVTARIVGLESGEEVPVGHPGEIVIEGPMVVPGYWGKPDATAATIRNGRLHTGDVGTMDAAGWFYVIDRAKDQINASGFKIWPREVEDVLYEHPAVREAVVVGVADQYRGETVKAFVALADGSNDVDAGEIIAFCKERLAAYKYPRVVEFLDELPKTTSGKFMRRMLREQ